MKAERILSIDIFRGLTIFLMVFVNELAGVSNIPDWMKHIPPGENGMTFVDVVFPAFLFIVGMAIPFAVLSREVKGEGAWSFWGHVLTRTLGLVVLGVYMVNAEEMNKDANLITYGLWASSLYVAAILIWNRYPKTTEKRQGQIYLGLKLLGVAILIVLYFLFRKGSEGQLTGMTPSWWGILGLIGWAYLLSIIAYMLSDKNLGALVGIFVGLLAVLLLLRSDAVSLPSILDGLKGQTGHLGHTVVTLSGVICSLLLMKGGVMDRPSVKILHMLILGVLLLVIGYFVQPFGGISKIAATPSWALFSAASCCFLFPLVYWLVDVKGIKNWATFVKPAGQNPLLTYILPPLLYAILGYGFIPDLLSSGFPGFMRALVFSLLMLLLTKWLTKKGIRLHL
jgi:predicted acyltransferase